MPDSLTLSPSEWVLAETESPQAYDTAQDLNAALNAAASALRRGMPLDDALDEIFYPAVARAVRKGVATSDTRDIGHDALEEIAFYY